MAAGVTAVGNGPSSGKTKADALAEAGISTSAAQRYEELAGGREEQAQASGKAAMEHYFAESRAIGEPASMSGLRGAIREALVATLGEPPSARVCAHRGAEPGAGEG